MDASTRMTSTEKSDLYRSLVATTLRSNLACGVGQTDLVVG